MHDRKQKEKCIIKEINLLFSSFILNNMKIHNFKNGKERKIQIWREDKKCGKHFLCAQNTRIIKTKTTDNFFLCMLLSLVFLRYWITQRVSLLINRNHDLSYLFRTIALIAFLIWIWTLTLLMGMKYNRFLFIFFFYEVWNVLLFL